jgi:hypothetical protein
MKTPEERLKLLEEIFENFMIAMDKARMEAMTRYHIEALGWPQSGEQKVSNDR